MKGATMTARRVLGSIVMMLVLTLFANAGGKEQLQKYFGDAANKVKATSTASEKREILNASLNTMSKALDIVQALPLLSKNERDGIHRYKSAIQDKQDELAGRNGYVRVADGQLNAFSNYIVQDMEQADGTVTIGIVTLLLIIILAVLIL
jgi:hypothetical protein